MLNKKIFIVILILILSALLFNYQNEFIQFFQDIETRKNLNPLVIAIALITFQTLTAPLGLPGVPITILIGAIFGLFFGTIIALLGSLLGGCLAFLLSRYILQNYIQKKVLPRHPKIKRYEKKLAQRGFVTVFALRVVPVFPFNSLNLLLGTTKISFNNFAIGTFLGILPGTFLFVYFGESLRMLNPINIVLAIIGLAILTYLSMFYGKSR
jgi:uncharacterized membrane protein YdjX (TVP38/TMEM64 family)